MSYVDTQEFREKAERFREARDRQRQAAGRELFDIETARLAGSFPASLVDEMLNPRSVIA